MSGWIWIALFVAVLLGVGLWTDHKRRHSAGGGLRGVDPTEARRGAQAGEVGHGGGGG